MSQKAFCQITVGGEDISLRLAPYLISLRIGDNEGTHSDMAEITLDDTGGQLLLPRDGATMVASLGWESEGASVIFTGTVDEVKSSGDRRGGRILRISAKGVDTKGKAKEPQLKHMDDMTAEQALNEAGTAAGIAVRVDPKFAALKREWWGMDGESFIHFGERLARELGGVFKMRGNEAILADKTGGSISGAAVSTVEARWGDNLISWDIAPRMGRPQFANVVCRWYDLGQAKWNAKATPVAGTEGKADYSDRFSRPSEDEADGSGQNGAKDSEREKGGGSCSINGTALARPGGTCIISGARPGVDGPYRIESVEHDFSRGGGWETRITLKMPGDGTGKDSRASRA